MYYIVMKKLNKSTHCLVCFGLPEPEFKLVKHHVSYFPEIVCFVHYKCHKLIHDGKRPDLIQFKTGDSRKFYEMKKAMEELK